jgi:putative ABC transport system permease protein
MMGIVLAVSLIAGSSIAVDSSAYGVLRAALDSIPVDFQATYNTQNWDYQESWFSQTIDTIKTIRYIEEASPVAYSTGNWDAHRTDQQAVLWGYDPVMWLPADSTKIIESYRITGTLPTPGTVAISEYLALDLMLDVGDSVALTYTSYTYNWDPVNFTYVYEYTYYNFTFPVSQIWTQDTSAQKQYDGYYYSLSPGQVRILDSMDPVILNMEDAYSVLSVINSENPYTAYTQVTILIWVDRNEAINLGNIGASIQRLEYVYGRLSYYSTIGGGYYISYGSLLNALQSLQSDFESKKLLFFGLSLPVVALGTYLSLVGIDLGLTARRREVGILKSRGASKRQVFSAMFFESVILGVGSGLIGLLLGVLVSRFILGSAATLWQERDVPTQLTDVLVSEWTVSVTILFSIFLMVASSYRPMRRASKMDVAEALHQFTAKTTKLEYKPLWDIAALVLVANSIISILWSPSGGFESQGSFIVTIVLSVLWIIGLSCLPLVPFLLAVSSVRLVTRGSRKIYAKFTWLFKKWTGELHHLVDRNIVRNPKRASNVCIIVALALAFGLFISITMESYMNYQVNLVKYDVGADVKVSGWSSWNVTEFGASMEELDAIGSIEGVADHTIYYTTSFVSGFGYYAGVGVIHADEYLRVVDPGDRWFPEKGDHVLEELQQNGTVIVDENTASYMYILVGDVIPVTIETREPYAQVQFSLTVIGFCSGMPGLYDDMYVDNQTLAWLEGQAYQGSAGAFVDVAKGADHTEVGQAVLTAFTDEGFSANVLVAEDELATMSSSLEFGPLRDFLYMEYVLSFIIMTVGVGLIIFVTVWDRERELACIMARGASGSQMRKILMGESFTLMVIGVLIGAIVGLLTAWIFSTLIAESFYEEVEYVMVFSKISLVILLSSVVAFVFATLLATLRAGKIKLAEVLRVRGG